jgi:hypothetical protein
MSEREPAVSSSWILLNNFCRCRDNQLANRMTSGLGVWVGIGQGETRSSLLYDKISNPCEMHTSFLLSSSVLIGELVCRGHIFIMLGGCFLHRESCREVRHGISVLIEEIAHRNADVPSLYHGSRGDDKGRTPVLGPSSWIFEKNSRSCLFFQRHQQISKLIGVAMSDS